MPTLIPIQYGSRGYPPGIVMRLQEVAGHFDVKRLNTSMNYSLHTEYAYGKRKYDTDLVSSYPIIRNSSKDDVPQLWKSNSWSEAFAKYIIDLVTGCTQHTIIEIHPPFDDYCTSIDDFIQIYEVFEKRILEKLNNVKILLENRCGSIYRGGKFLISTSKDCELLTDKIQKDNLILRLVVDFPQLFAAHGTNTYSVTKKQIADLVNSVKPYRYMVAGIHIWGKRKSNTGRPVAHQGNLDTLFENNDNKTYFLKALYDLFDDGLARYFVPEVNSGSSDVEAIVNDFIKAGFEFKTG